MGYDIKELQNCQMDILAEIDRVCKKNDLRYCLAYGTCLGAIRHEGFIPWDDDIDIWMPAEDFKKLNDLSTEFKEPFFLQNHKTDPEYGLMITRIRNSNTTLIESFESHRNINHGVFVDIYPLFNCSESILKRKQQTYASLLFRLLLYGAPPRNHGKFFKIAGSMLLKIVPKALQSKLLLNLMKIVEGEPTGKYVSTFYVGQNRFFPTEAFFPVRMVPFNDIVAPVPNDAETVLTIHYGNFMELPPEEKRIIHHEYSVVDINNSYIKYRK